MREQLIKGALNFSRYLRIIMQIITPGAEARLIIWSLQEQGDGIHYLGDLGETEDLITGLCDVVTGCRDLEGLKKRLMEQENALLVIEAELTEEQEEFLFALQREVGAGLVFLDTHDRLEFIRSRTKKVTISQSPRITMRWREWDDQILERFATEEMK